MPNPQVPALHLSIHWVWSQVSCWCSCPSCEQRSQRGVSKVKLIFCDWFELFCQVWWSRDHCQHDFDWSVLWRGRCMESSSYNLLWENLLWCCLNKRPMAPPLGKTKLSCWPIVLLKETKKFLATRLLHCVQWTPYWALISKLGGPYKFWTQPTHPFHQSKLCNRFGCLVKRKRLLTSLTRSPHSRVTPSTSTAARLPPFVRLTTRLFLKANVSLLATPLVGGCGMGTRSDTSWSWWGSRCGPFYLHSFWRIINWRLVSL